MKTREWEFFLGTEHSQTASVNTQADTTLFHLTK